MYIISITFDYGFCLRPPGPRISCRPIIMITLITVWNDTFPTGDMHSLFPAHLPVFSNSVGVCWGVRFIQHRVGSWAPDHVFRCKSGTFLCSRSTFRPAYSLQQIPFHVCRYFVSFCMVIYDWIMHIYFCSLCRFPCTTPPHVRRLWERVRGFVHSSNATVLFTIT